jgi:hypothetical protein
LCRTLSHAENTNCVFPDPTTRTWFNLEVLTLLLLFIFFLSFYVLFIHLHLLIIIKYTSIYTDYLPQKEITNISVCSFHKQGHWVFALLFVKVFSFLALFLWPCLRAQVAVLGIVSSPSVEVVNFVFLGHLFPWLKNLCSATAFSFSDLLCQAFEVLNCSRNKIALCFSCLFYLNCKTNKIQANHFTPLFRYNSWLEPISFMASTIKTIGKFQWNILHPALAFWQLYKSTN